MPNLLNLQITGIYWNIYLIYLFMLKFIETSNRHYFIIQIKWMQQIFLRPKFTRYVVNSTKWFWLKIVVVPKDKFLGKQISLIILWLQMILWVVFYERKNIFYVRKLILTKNNILITFFLLEFFLIPASHMFFKNDWIFINHGLFFRGKYILQSYFFQFWK